MAAKASPRRASLRIAPSVVHLAAEFVQAHKRFLLSFSIFSISFFRPRFSSTSSSRLRVKSVKAPPAVICGPLLWRGGKETGGNRSYAYGSTDNGERIWQTWLSANRQPLRAQDRVLEFVHENGLVRCTWPIFRCTVRPLTCPGFGERIIRSCDVSTVCCLLRLQMYTIIRQKLLGELTSLSSSYVFLWASIAFASGLFSVL